MPAAGLTVSQCRAMQHPVVLRLHRPLLLCLLLCQKVKPETPAITADSIRAVDKCSTAHGQRLRHPLSVRLCNAIN